MRKSWKFGFSVVVLLTVFHWFAGVSSAQINQGNAQNLYNTGVYNGNNPPGSGTLADAAKESNYVPGPYTITLSNIPVTPPYTITPPYVTVGPIVNGGAGSGWPTGESTYIIAAKSPDAPFIAPLGDNTTSDWIGPGNNAPGAIPTALDPKPIGGATYDFQTTFYDPGGPYNITGQWSCDNWGVDILLDGSSTGNAIALPSLNAYSGSPNDQKDFSMWTPFTIASQTSTQEAPGWHTLDFITYTSATQPFDTALRVEFTAVPEPSTLALLGVGAAGLLGCVWRRRKPVASPAISFFTSHTPLKTRRTKVNRRVLLLILAILSPVMFGWLADVSWAQGGPIHQGPVTGLWNTGVSSSGSVLPDGTLVDPHYSLISVPSGPPPPLAVATATGGPPITPNIPYWLGDDSQSAWIGPAQYAAAPSPLQLPSQLGDYDFQTTFTLSSAGAVSISGQWSAAGLGYDILLDGQSTGAFTLPGTVPYPTDCQYWTPFAITGTGVLGTNTLDFLVNQPYAPNGVAAYTGLRVEFTPSSVPEPSTLALLGVGAIGLLGCAWRRRRRAASLATNSFTTHTPLETRRTQMNRGILLLVLAIVSPVVFGLSAGVSWAQGGPITQDLGLVTDLYNTGVVAGGGFILSNGTVGDPHYSLVYAPSGSSTVLAVATSAAGSPPIPPWLPDDSQSAWIGPAQHLASPSPLQSPAVTTYGGVPYDYQTTFTLAASAATTVSITGQWSADTGGVDILFDGISTGALAASPTSWSLFSISGLAQPGTNTLDFLVDKTTTGTTLETGLRVEFTPSSVPEPSTLVLLGAGAVGVLGCVWRRRKRTRV